METKLCDKKSASIDEFAKEIGVSRTLAYGMARCELFQRLKISYDISIRKKQIGKNKKRQYCNWRFNIPKYYEAIEKGLL